MESMEPDLYLSARLHKSQLGALCELSRGIPGCGAWIRSREYIDSARLRVVIEFPRELSPEVYGALMGAGLELSNDSHLLLTELCRCAPYLRQQPALTRPEPPNRETGGATSDEESDAANEAGNRGCGNPAALCAAPKPVMPSPVIRVQIQIALGASEAGRPPHLNPETNPI